MPSTTLFIDPTRQNLGVSSYYTLFPAEPTPSDHAPDWPKVSTPHVALKDERLDTLLDAIAKKATPGGNVLFVGHGFEAGLWLFIGDPRTKHIIDFPSLDSIRRNQEGKRTDSDTAQDLELTVDAYKQLKLDRVDARSCEIGKNDVLMSALQVFFGCNTFCAPRILDAIGNFPYQPFAQNKAEFDKWIKEKNPHATVEGTSPNRFAFALKDVSEHGARAMGRAESRKGIMDWTGKHLPSPDAVFNGNHDLFIHGAMTGTNDSFFFAGDPEYRKMLVEAKKGVEPSRKADINQPLPRPTP